MQVQVIETSTGTVYHSPTVKQVNKHVQQMHFAQDLFSVWHNAMSHTLASPTVSVSILAYNFMNHFLRNKREVTEQANQPKPKQLVCNQTEISRGASPTLACSMELLSISTSLTQTSPCFF